LLVAEAAPIALLAVSISAAIGALLDELAHQLFLTFEYYQGDQPAAMISMPSTTLTGGFLIVNGKPRNIQQQ